MTNENGKASGKIRAAAEAVSFEVRECFNTWRNRNFLGGAMGRIGTVGYSRAGELDDVCAGDTHSSRAAWYGDAYERALIDHTERLSFEEADFLLHNPLIVLQMLLGITDLRALRCYRRGLTHEVNRLQRRAYRRRYYAGENSRRRALAAERRKITRRRTTNPCPTPDDLRVAWARRGESAEAKVRLGGMVHDLECYVDNCLRFDANGEICGRNGGIRAWLVRNAPDLSEKYKSLMRYKAFAKRLRQAAGIKDPVPTSAIFDGAPPADPVEGDRARRRRHDQADECRNAREILERAGCPRRPDGNLNENYSALNSHDIPTMTFAVLDRAVYMRLENSEALNGCERERNVRRNIETR